MHASHTAAKYMEQTLTKHFLNINTTSKDRENLTPTRPKKSSKDRENLTTTNHTNRIDLYGILMASWRRRWHPTPVLLPGKSHGRRSLVGYSPWGCLESDTTERLHFHFSLSSIGAGNGTPLQCSGLENPRDGGAWWAAIYGVTQSQTQLKRLSSSSMANRWGNSGNSDRLYFFGLQNHCRW